MSIRRWSRSAGQVLNRCQSVCCLSELHQPQGKLVQPPSAQIGPVKMLHVRLPFRPTSAELGNSFGLVWNANESALLLYGANLNPSIRIVCTTCSRCTLFRNVRRIGTSIMHAVERMVGWPKMIEEGKVSVL